MWEGGLDRGVQLAERSARLSFSLGELSLSLSSSPPHHPSAHTCGSAAAAAVCGLLDLHAAAVHLDDLGSEGLDGSQDQLLVLKGSDAKTQYISVDTWRFSKTSKTDLNKQICWTVCDWLERVPP